MQPTAGKQLFAHPYRVRRPAPLQARAPRLLNGQAMAEAQRLNRPRLRVQVIVGATMAVDLAVLVLVGQGLWLLFPPVQVLNALAMVWAGALVAVATIRLWGGYRFWRLRAARLSAPRLWPGLAAALAVAGGLGALEGPAPGGMLMPALVWVGIAAVALTAARVAVAQWIGSLIQRGRVEHRLVLVGGGEALARTLSRLEGVRREGYRVCGFFDARGDHRSPDVVHGQHKMGNLDDLVDFVRMAQIDTIILAVPDLSPTRLYEMLGILSLAPVEVRAVPGPGMALPEGARVSRIGAQDLVVLCRPPLGPYAAIQKRAFDLVTASLALVLLAPVLALVALAVRLDSPGPILFRQARHGFNNRPVQVLKFRSMYADRCDPTAVKAVRQGDARVTRVGRFIRRTSLDELPQLFNVLAGDLSMVGPRPHATAARTGDILFDQVIARYSARSRVKPGITGWAQINGWRGELNSAEKIRARVEHDLHYIDNWSLWLDIRILALTPLALIRAKNAY